MNEHPLTPVAEALESIWGRGIAYLLSWWLGISQPVLWERLFYAPPAGDSFKFQDMALGVVTLSMLVSPIGWLIAASNIILLPIFSQSHLRYWWILWPFASGCLWRNVLGE